MILRPYIGSRKGILYKDYTRELNEVSSTELSTLYMLSYYSIL